jgi:hypothetical protein
MILKEAFNLIRITLNMCLIRLLNGGWQKASAWQRREGQVNRSDKLLLLCGRVFRFDNGEQLRFSFIGLHTTLH